MSTEIRADLQFKAAKAVADGFDFHVMSTADTLAGLDLEPFGVRLNPVDFVAGTGGDDWDVGDFAHLYNALNGLSFGAADMGMPLWVQIDLGMLPSAFVLLCAGPDRFRALLDDPTIEDPDRARLVALGDLAEQRRFDGPIPIAGYCAAPSAVPGRWVGWSSCSLRRGFGSLTKGLGLETYGADRLVGVTQYTNEALRMHRKFGAMRVLSSLVPLHPQLYTLIYETTVWEDPDADASPTTVMQQNDGRLQRQLERRIRAGELELRILSPGRTDDGQIPLLEVST